MAYQVLSTKLYNPPVKPGLVRRPRLVQRLEAGYQAGKRVTLISAPAGFGKTTLISEWIAGMELGKPFGWVSLDDGDNDPLRFLTYLVTAIQKVYGEIGRSVLTLLQSSQNPNLTDLVEALINEISAAPKPFLIVLDDYHLIKNIDVHSLMRLFLKQLPNVLHLVISTREDPPLSLPRMRVQGQVTEIRERDLRFTLPETQTFLVEAMGIVLSSEEVEKLSERTEGWAAGMQLAALALEEFQNDEGRRSFIEAFAGSDRLIVDYLISEVIQRLPETTQQFLLCTSILERFCAELSDTVVFDQTNSSYSQQILDSLEQSNMFMVPLDNQRSWYRYHHLFSEMLYHSLRRSSPDRIPVLHRRASEWFEARGFTQDAAQHALASKDWDFFHALLNRHALHLIFQGNSSLVIEWCREVPKSYLEKSPDICIYYAWALVLTFRDDFRVAVEEKLQLAGRAIEKPDLPTLAQVGEGRVAVIYRDWVIGHMCVIRSQILLGHFNQYIDPQELIALSLRGLELLPEVERAFLATCKINLAHAQLMQNDPVGAQKAFEDALPFMLEAGNFLSAVTTIFYQARLAYYTGKIALAESLCQQWKTRFVEMARSIAVYGQVVPEIPAIRGLDIVQSIVLMERNQLEEAESLLVQSLDLLGWASWMELHGFIVLAHLQYLRGNMVGVQDTLHRMSRMGPQHAACAEALQVLFDIKRSLDDPQVRLKAETWVKKYIPNADPHPGDRFSLGIGPYQCDAEYFCNLAWARVQLALGKPQEAGLFIGPALASAKKHRLLFRIVELSIVQALIEDELNHPSAALTELGQALELAEAAGYARVFDEGVKLDRLLQQAVVRGIHAHYARQLLASFNRTPLQEKIIATASPWEKRRGDLVESLSERELEVLWLLAQGLTPARVAKQLVLSPNTLKAHTQNIYSKLDVHTRIEAINKARDLGLI